jgi:hypothetical protein
MNILTIPGRAIHPRTIHNRVADGLQRTLETVVLGDWRTLSEDQLKQAVARLRTIKASYLNHPMPPDHLEQPSLASLDEALVALYLALDVIEGRDVAKQRDIYRALLEVQHPLLRARAALPLPVDAVQFIDGEDEIRQTEASVAPAVAHSAPVIQQDGAEETHGEYEDDKDVHGQAKQFRWSQGRLLQLQEAMRESRQSNTQAMIKEIATHFGWPVNAVSSKVYALRLHPNGAQDHTQEQAVSEDAKEDDRRNRRSQFADGTRGRSQENA